MKGGQAKAVEYIKVVTKQIQNRQVSQPSGSGVAPSKRVPDMLKGNKDWVVDEWLRRVNTNAELTHVSLSDAERKDHVPDLLDDAIAYACDHPIRMQERQKAAERHGTLRYHQGYSVAMLILEAQLLQDVIAECLQHNFLAIDLSHLIADIAKVWDTITAELRESARAFMKQREWHASQSAGRS
jgi:RsbRD-like negative regulator of sigma factor